MDDGQYLKLQCDRIEHDLKLCVKAIDQYAKEIDGLAINTGKFKNTVELRSEEEDIADLQETLNKLKYAAGFEA